MNKNRIIQMIQDDNQLIMDLAHIVVVNQAALGGTSKLASDLAKCHQHNITHSQE